MMRLSQVWKLCAVLPLVFVPAPSGEAAESASFMNEAVIDASTSEVWQLITTKEGMESWMVPHADIDLRVGGLMRTNHDPDGTIGDSKTVTNRILAVVPKKMVSLKVAGAPAWIPFADYVTGSWYEVFLSPLPHGRTRVRCVGRGFGKGPLEFAARAFVDRGNVWALERLQKVITERRGATGSK